MCDMESQFSQRYSLARINRLSFQAHQSSVIVRTPPDACHFGESFSILFRWKKSIYRMIWRHSLIYLTIYFSLSILHDYGLSGENKKHFQALTEYFSQKTRSFNWMIMLGFFTNTALHRMFTMQLTMPGTTKPTTVFIMSLKQDLPEGPVIVDQYARWMVLVWILTFRSVCKPLRDRFPDLTSIQNAGILNGQERKVLERELSVPRPLIIVEWILLLLKESLANDRYINKSSHNKNVEAIMTFKKSCSTVVKFSTQNIPYAVIQAAIIVVYCFGLITAMARNLPEFKDEYVRTFIAYFPIVPYMQFFVFIAWLSFGRAAVNPFGHDETDIDILKLSQFHIQDCIRLKNLYTKKLDDVFFNLPQKMFKPNEEKSKDQIPKELIVHRQEMQSQTEVSKLIEIQPQENYKAQKDQESQTLQEMFYIQLNAERETEHETQTTETTKDNNPPQV